jgi:ribokinase
MARIAVVGSLNMDLVVRTARFARPGETLSGQHFVTVPGGKGANQAVSAQRVGGHVTMIGCVGEDGFGQVLRQVLADEGIDVGHVGVAAGTATGVALITVDEHGENTIIVVAGANGAITAGDVEAAAPAIAAADVLLLQLEVPLPTVEAAARAARAGGTTVILNAAPAGALDDRLLALVDYLVVNETEVLAVAGVEHATPEDAARLVLTRGGGAVVVTLGAAGALLVPRRGEPVAMEAFRVAVVDTTAAGDAFVGAFAVALAEGAPADEALRRASAAGALAVTRPGAQPSLPTRDDVQVLLDRWRDS